jgi:hypothetical protein
MFSLRTLHNTSRRRIKIGRRTYSLGAVAVVAGVLLLASGGAVYARLGGTANPSSTSSIDLQKGLVGRWKMDGNAKDATPYAHNGTVSGATLTTDRKGRANSAYDFSGTSQYITIPDNTDDKPTTTGLSVSVWVKPSSLTVDKQRIISTTEGGGYVLSLNETSSSQCSALTVCFGVYVNGVQRATEMPKSLLTNGTWNLITATYDGTTIKLYLDGVLKNSSNWTGSMTYTGSIPLCIGAEPGTSSCTDGGSGFANFYGAMDDARIYKRAITLAEVKALANAYDGDVKPASGEKGLVGWWQLDGTLKDSTPYEDNGIGTSVTYGSDRKSAASKAAVFDNTATMVTVAHKAILKPTTALTVSTWVKPAGIANGGTDQLVTNTQAGGYGLTIVGTTANICAANMVQFIVNIAGTYNGVCYAKSNLSNGTWYLITGTYDGANLKLYVNGSQVDTLALTGAIREPGVAVPLCFGADAGATTCGTQIFNGSMDDIRIYNRALAQNEIQRQYTQYNSQINLNTSPTSGANVNLGQGLVGYWPFNGDAKDSTPYAHNGTLVASPSLTTDRKGRANSAYSFVEGSCQSVTVPDAASLRLNGTFSVGFWFKDNGSVTSFPGIVSKGLPGTSGSGWNIFYRSATHSISYKRDNNELISASAVVTTNWRQFVLTYDGTNLSWYVDGAFLNSAAKTYATNTGTQTISIGVQSTNCSSSSIDDLRIWNRAVTLSEVQSLYASYR